MTLNDNDVITQQLRALRQMFKSLTSYLQKRSMVRRFSPTFCEIHNSNQNLQHLMDPKYFVLIVQSIVLIAHRGFLNVREVYFISSLKDFFGLA